ncbi:MAG: S1C family serine protease [Clostridium sp.]
MIAHEGGSFIIPINDAKPVIEALMKEGKLDTPFLGVKTFLIDDERSEHYNVPKGLGVLDVVEGTTAQKYGIEKGDIILSVSGGKVTKITDITDMLEGKKSGDKVPVNVYRNGKEVVIDAILIGKK